MKKSLSHFVVKFIYADHNSSFSVKKELRSIFKEADIGAKVLNIGSGNVRIHPKIVNIDIFQGENIDISCDIQLAIPIDSNSVDWIITQECFEHLRSPGKALYECFRVLRNNGKIYFQVPFIIGYHPGPHDYYRFTKEGILSILEDAGFSILKYGTTVDSATGYYRISVEFFAIIFSLVHHKLYRLFKGFFSLILYPIKLLDPLVKRSQENDRIAGGYWVIAKKSEK